MPTVTMPKSVTISLPNASELSQELREKLAIDLVTNPVRKLTPEEREIYAGGVIQAVRILPAFRDAVGLLNPYMDATAPTAYTDSHARVGLSYWFLHVLNPIQRGSVILHEAMHVMNNHFIRGEVAGIDNELMNIAGDFEINTTLDRSPHVDLSCGIFPNKGEFNYPTGMTLEQYALLLQNDNYKSKLPKISGPDSKNAPSPEGQGSGAGQPGECDDGHTDPQDCEGQPCEGTGNPGEMTPGNGQGNQPGSGSGQVTDDDDGKNWGCSSSTEQRSEAADKAGVDRSSVSEQNNVKANTAARISEEIQKSRAAGKGHEEEMYRLILDKLQPPRVDWRQIFRRILASANDTIIRGRSDYSHKKVSRRLSSSKYIFPGMVKYVPTAMLGIDISGSMTKDDFLRTLTEAEGIMQNTARSKGGLGVFSVDTQVGKTKVVKSVKEVNLTGGGGTAMEVGVQFITSLAPKDRPDIFVLATDGGTDWYNFEQACLEIYRKVKIVVLVTSEYGWGTIHDSMKELVTMIDVSKD